MKRKKQNKLTKHHIIPSSRKGTNLENNVCFVPNIQHERYHNLFDNRTPEEIIDYLVTDFWDGQQTYIDKYKEKYRK